MDTHIDLLVVRIRRAQSLGHLLRGVRRSRVLALRHGVRWAVVRDAAYARARFAAGAGRAVAA